MPDERDEPTQQTPAGDERREKLFAELPSEEAEKRTAKGGDMTIPVPKRGDVFGDLEKVAKPKEEKSV